jgi:DUF971 family protein
LLFNSVLVTFDLAMVVTAAPTPTEIRRLGKSGVTVRWSDDHRSEYANHYLRQHCPCAVCRERPLRALPVVGPGGAALYPIQIGVVGRYAISIQWSDGHDTGIYSYRTLRDVCPCAQCQPAASAPETASS